MIDYPAKGRPIAINAQYEQQYKQSYLFIYSFKMLEETKMSDLWIDKQEISEILALYAHYADTRQAEKQAALFTPGAIVNVFPSPKAKEPVQRITDPAELLAGFKALNQYQQTFHFNGQSLITVEPDGQKASGETYNLAHHIKNNDAKRTIMVMAIRTLSARRAPPL